MSKKYFVEYTEYAGFGSLTEHRETFTTWSEMERFKRQLRPGAVLGYGEIRSQHSAEKRAA